MVLNDMQLRILVLKFDNADVWNQVCQNIVWTNIDKVSFLHDLNSDTSLKRSLIRIAIRQGELHTPYDNLVLNINAEGSVKTELKLRIDRMKLVYQKVYANVTLTPEQVKYRRQKLWDYIQEDRTKWGE